MWSHWSNWRAIGRRAPLNQIVDPKAAGINFGYYWSPGPSGLARRDYGLIDYGNPDYGRPGELEFSLGLIAWGEGVDIEKAFGW
jgi:hypothetical protein